MSRNYANISTAIWRKEEFRALTVGAQHMYLLLASQQDISAAGVLPLSVKRWSNQTTGATTASVIAALNELSEHRYVVYDTETEELLVRSFVKWDNGYGNPKRRPVIQRAALDVESPAIRRALAAEFKRLGLPDWLPDSLSPPQAEPSSDDSAYSQGNSLSGRQSPSDGVVVTTVGTSTSTHNPQTTPHPPAGGLGGEAAAKPAKTARGTRVPEDFAITTSMREWAVAKVPGLDIDHHTEAMLDHFRAAPGAKGVKLDWTATWRNWMRTEHGRYARTGSNVVPLRRSSTDERVAGWLALEAPGQEAYR